MNHSNKISTVIWDWNGTLLEDTWLCVDIINGVLRTRSLPEVSLERHRELFQFPVIEFYRLLGFDLAAESFEILGDEFMSQYEQRKFECRLFEGIPKLLQALRRGGFSQSILSAYHHDYLVDILEHFELHEAFDHVLGSDDHYATGKKAQAGVLLERLGVDPLEVLLVGDTIHDYEVARSVGIQCRLVSTGNHPRSKLEATGAEVFDCAEDALGDLLS